MPETIKMDMRKLMEVYQVDNVISSLEKELFLVDPNNALSSVHTALKALKEDTIDDYTSILDVLPYKYKTPNASAGVESMEDDIKSLLLEEPSTVYVPN